MHFNTTLQPNTEFTFQYDFYPNPQNLDVDSKYQLALSLFYENEVNKNCAGYLDLIVRRFSLSC